MACEDALQAQDEWVATLLGAGPELTLAGDALTLTSGDTSITAVEA